MKKNRIYFGLLILALVVTIVWTSAGMLGVNKEEKKYSVSVIVNDSNNDRWIAMREGLEQAAKDDDIQLNYVSTGVFASEDEEKALIEREVENGADGIIVQLVSSEDTYAVFEKIDSSVAVMLLETDAVSEGVYSVTAPDNLWIGEALAQTVLQDYGDSLSEKKIGILSGNQNQLSMQQRLGSVKKLLEDENIEPVWILSGQGENLSSELVTKQADEPVDILITLGNAETETAVDYLQADTSYKRQFMIYGEGCSDKTVYYLDKGIIKSLVVPNEFNMGYGADAKLTVSDPTALWSFDSGDATQYRYAREAMHHLLYVMANSHVMNGAMHGSVWVDGPQKLEVVRWVATGVSVVGLGLIGFTAWRNHVKRRAERAEQE